MISKSELFHYKIQAAIREKNISKSEIEYIGEGDGTHWYRIAGKHTVPVNMIESFEEVNDAS